MSPTTPSSGASPSCQIRKLTAMPTPSNAPQCRCHRYESVGSFPRFTTPIGWLRNGLGIATWKTVVMAERAAFDFRSVMSSQLANNEGCWRSAADACHHSTLMSSTLVFFIRMHARCRYFPRRYRDWPKYSVSVLAPKLTYNAVSVRFSVTVTTPHFTLGFGLNCTAHNRNWPKLEWAILRHWMGLHTLHMETNFELKP